MTQLQFNKEFKAANPNWYYMTLTDRRQHYNEFIQAYFDFGNITERQRQNWGHPQFLKSFINRIDPNKY